MSNKFRLSSGGEINRTERYKPKLAIEMLP